jgi:predicted metal-dependent hydrolase
MITQIELAGIVVDVVRKDIKNVHLSVYPPTGRVRIAAPLRMKSETIRVFAISKLAWIKQQQKKLRAQERESPREYLDRESHHVWGKRYLLRIIDAHEAANVRLRHRTLDLRIRPGATPKLRAKVIDAWYRQQLRDLIPSLIAKWEPRLGVNANQFFVQRMKTKWGSCSPARANIRLNTELAKKPAECLEYVVVHELSHLIERHHNDRFVKLLDRHIPQWRMIRDELNTAPLSHEKWNQR